VVPSVGGDEGDPDVKIAPVRVILQFVLLLGVRIATGVNIPPSGKMAVSWSGSGPQPSHA
jgi:hypothetical protein